MLIILWKGQVESGFLTSSSYLASTSGNTLSLEISRFLQRIRTSEFLGRKYHKIFCPHTRMKC